MVGGMLSGCGYFMGYDLYISSRDANPKGFFEDRQINSINEELLLHVPGAAHYPYGHRWHARVPLGVDCVPAPDIAEWIADQTSHVPFCFKDPRFCYTLPAWQPYIGDALLICVFREPTRTAHSIVEEIRRTSDDRTVELDYDGALELWVVMYRHVLERHRFQGDWLFVHYDQLVEGSRVGVLESSLHAKVDWSFPDASLKRSSPDGEITEDAGRVYRELCEMANYARVEAASR